MQWRGKSLHNYFLVRMNSRGTVDLLISGDCVVDEQKDDLARILEVPHPSERHVA